MFETAQWAVSSDAAASLAQMATRSAKGSPQLASLVRERQDLVSEWHAKDKQLVAAKSETPEARKAEAEEVLAQRLEAINTRLAEIEWKFAQDFPDYAALASPTPLSVEEVQALLGVDDALVLFLDTPKWKPLPEESFIWVVTNADLRWVRSGLGTAALGHEVAALHSRAYKLYSALFGEVHDLIKGKHLLIVPSDPLTLLPFQVLVTRPPASGDHCTTAWLAREHAITILPAVSSLKALRRVGKPSTAPRPMIGFGNPQID
jgi:hypothetical protein